MVITKEARTFYSMMALIKSAKSMCDYLFSSRSVTHGVKHELQLFFRKFDIMQEKMTGHLSQEDKTKWNEDWKRDYESFASVLNYMSDMTDGQRDKLEEFAKELVNVKPCSVDDAPVETEEVC